MELIRSMSPWTFVGPDVEPTVAKELMDHFAHQLSNGLFERKLKTVVVAGFVS